MDPADGSQIQNAGGTFSISSGTDTFFNDTWHHVVAQYNPGYPNNNGYIKLYIDGVSQGETSIGNHQMGINYGSTAGIRFGSTNHGSWTPASMKIDDTKIYNYILTKTQIKRLAQPKILHYKFDDKREEATENLFLTNPTLSNNASGWNLHTATIENRGDITRMTALTTYSGISQAVSMVIGAIYTISYYYRHISGSNLTGGHLNSADNALIRVDGGTWIGSTTVTVPDDGKFHLIEQQFEAIAASGTQYMQAGRGATTTVVGEYYLGVQIEKLSHTTPFVDGIREGVIIKDSSLAQNHGTVTLANSPVWTSGDVSYGAMEFGLEDKVLLNNPIEVYNDFTISY